MLTAPETIEHRSCGGAPGWLGEISRPDIMAGTSLATCGQPALEQPKKLNELVDYTQATKDAGIVLRPLPLDPAQLIVVSYADASFANAPNLKSQGGLAVCLATRDALAGSAPASVLDWKFGRLRRVVRSTLAAEACSADAGVDHGAFICLCLTELVGKGDAISSDSVFEHYHATDCRSFYDCVHKNFGDLERGEAHTSRREGHPPCHNPSKPPMGAHRPDARGRPHQRRSRPPSEVPRVAP